MKIERLPVRSRPGFDCLYGTCPYEPKDRKHVGGNSHGIFGGAWFFVVRTEHEGKKIALVLEVLGNAYPATVPESHLADWKKPPRGATLSLHVEARGVECEWVGTCDEDRPMTYCGADEFYKTHGDQSLARDADLSLQTEAFWLALEAKFIEWIAQQHTNERGVS